MKFTHIDNKGNIAQVPIDHKKIVRRKAFASGFIRLSKETLNRIQSNEISKGNVLATAKIAGILAAKRTGELIPLCHSILLEHVSVDFVMGKEGIEVLVSTTTTGKTGVEIEALMAVQIALLTIYDMCKAVDRKMSLERILLVKKVKEEVL